MLVHAQLTGDAIANNVALQPSHAPQGVMWSFAAICDVINPCRQVGTLHIFPRLIRRLCPRSAGILNSMALLKWLRLLNNKIFLRVEPDNTYCNLSLNRQGRSFIAKGNMFYRQEKKVQETRKSIVLALPLHCDVDCLAILQHFVTIDRKRFMPCSNCTRSTFPSCTRL